MIDDDGALPGVASLSTKTARSALRSSPFSNGLVLIVRLFLHVSSFPSKGIRAMRSKNARLTEGGSTGPARWNKDAKRNPHLGFLARAGRFTVTSDSASMTTEAIATGHLVTVFDVPLR